MTYYYWAAFVITFATCLYIPTKRMSSSDNFGGSLVVALFGFIIWPVCVFAAYKVYRRRHVVGA